MPDQLDEVGVTEAVAGTRTYVFYEAAVLGTNTAQQGSPSTAPRVQTACAYPHLEGALPRERPPSRGGRS